MKRRRAPMPYAKALFALARERQQAELIGRELREVAATVGNIATLRDFFARPWVPAATKRTVAAEVAQRAGLSKLTSDFFALVAGRGRIHDLAAITDRYQKLMDEDLHQVRVRVRTAVLLTGQARDDLIAKLREVLGGRLILLAEIVDGTMLGGFIVESGNLVLDASLDAQLEQIGRRLGREDIGSGSVRC